MRKLRLIVLLGAQLAVGLGAGAAGAASPTSREYAATARALAGLTPGKPTSCITLSRTRTSNFLDRDTIAYRDTTRRYYVNRTGGGCNFDDDSILVTRTPSDQLCRGDIITLIDRTSQFPKGSCSFGDFVPYSRP